MDSADAKRALEILDDAHGLSAVELESYLDRVCGENSLLRREVLNYLDYDVEGTLLAGGMEAGAVPEIPAARTSEGRYELGDEIASGGMGVVLRAFDSNLHRNVAVKVLRSKWENKPDVVRRFLQEAQIGAQLQHPGIAPVYEIGRLPDGRPFIAMKLVKGATLEDLLAHRQDPGDDQAKFLTIFEQVCQTIAFAHRRGVIHRDLKPGNVMVGEFGEVQVMDWGIAKLLSDNQAESCEVEDGTSADTAHRDPLNVDTDGARHSTRVGQLLGTPAYMAPEQSIGRADKTADVYSLGAMLYEILTGEKTKESTDAAGEQLDRAGCDRALAELVKDCLQRNETDRPQNAGVVAARISDHFNAMATRLKDAEIATARAEVRAEEERKRRHRTVWTFAGVAMLLVTAGLVIMFVRNSARQRSLRERTKTVVTALSTSRGLLVPYVIEDLQDLPGEIVLAELRRQFDAGDETRRFRLAYGLASFGDVKVDLLVSHVGTCSPEEVDNLVQALGNSQDVARSALEAASQVAESNEDWRLKARLAMLALQLNFPASATNMCQPRPDPIQRTMFIEECSTWHGDLSRLARLVANVEDSPLRSAIALIVGSVPAAYQSAEYRQASRELMSNWYQMQPDTGTHSAAGWALRKWNLEVPNIVASTQPNDKRRWYVNSLGMTMLVLPAGRFVGERQALKNVVEQEFTVPRSFLLADREVTRAQFEQFIDDPQYPHDKKPTSWKGADIGYSPTEEHPVQNVTWFEAVLFCNWLSRQEELTPCYERIVQKPESNDPGEEYQDWAPIPDANGYRLPTEVEWEYACRAGAKTSFHFGEADSFLDRYAVHRPLNRTTSHAELPGSKMPSAWGLFDMHGNVSEWCQDWNRDFRGNVTCISDRDRMFLRKFRTTRGGSFQSPVSYLRSASRFAGALHNSDARLGFRVARNGP